MVDGDTEKDDHSRMPRRYSPKTGGRQLVAS